MAMDLVLPITALVLASAIEASKASHTTLARGMPMPMLMIFLMLMPMPMLMLTMVIMDMVLGLPITHTVLCEYWVWGTEEGEQKCWFRTGDSGREAGEGWISGKKSCHPPGTQKLIMGNTECWS